MALILALNNRGMNRQGWEGKHLRQTDQWLNRQSKLGVSMNKEVTVKTDKQ